MRVFTEIALSYLFNATLTSTLFVQTDVYEFKCCFLSKDSDATDTIH